MANINITQHAMDQYSIRGGLKKWGESGSSLGVMSYLREEALSLYSRNLGVFQSVGVVVDSFKAESDGMTFVFSKTETGHPALVTVY